MATPEVFVIVGAGLAGAKAAQALREEGFTGRVVLLGDEAERPYERPPLSKGYLLGDQGRAETHVHDARWYEENEVDLRLGLRVTGLDRAARRVALADGGHVGYTKLLLATGSSPRRLPVPGDDLPGVHYLRRLDQADRLRAALTPGSRVVVAGAGWIGLEVAAAARQRDCAVTVVEPAATPLHAALGPEMGGFFAGLHRAHGVDFRFGNHVTAFGGDERLTGVALADGVVLPADAAVVGVGVRPNTGLAELAGLAVDDGVVVDAALRTSDPDVYAAGDVASGPSTRYGRRLRVEHWANALNGGQAAAKSMLGREVVHDDLPYFFSDQYDVGMEFAGWFSPGGYDRVVVRGDVGSRVFHSFWLTGDRVVAGMHVNSWDEGLGAVRELIGDGRPVDVDRLADTSVPLTALAAG
ncbi:NAD(P)/FAD-dependent oxidoreductase [Saccharothrix australiensis]|uniref:3-phenylpropionate/trans-cinnamate dioxygenase ferredoxin reductase subunit n=1 Tax=Saccharothrix australiensis TaxID=2072 RepID=A0A495W0R3_9PSEU|nr:FAD-dependent oxidoreductase [Saccharothrix australiensis]RKT55262.1 3-phenylpropionate/trans-cinnamate dioxygenase ferredoxin reductase subunit [Saccharothrix australiensis]